MKKIILTGKVKAGLGDATYRIRQLTKVFCKKELCIGEFVDGTLNIELNEEYKNYPKKAIRGQDIRRFEKDEIPTLKNQRGHLYPAEGFTFIPVSRIQDESVDAYIYSSDGTGNEDNIIEVMAKFKIRERYKLKDGDEITIETITISD